MSQLMCQLYGKRRGGAHKNEIWLLILYARVERKGVALPKILRPHRLNQQQYGAACGVIDTLQGNSNYSPHGTVKSFLFIILPSFFYFDSNTVKRVRTIILSSGSTDCLHPYVSIEWTHLGEEWVSWGLCLKHHCTALVTLTVKMVIAVTES